MYKPVQALSQRGSFPQFYRFGKGLQIPRNLVTEASKRPSCAHPGASVHKLIEAALTNSANFVYYL